MAKVQGPLMSMNARGQLGKSLVFLGWKGIKTVRAHVVPANPQSDGQVAQRTIMTDAVALFHSTVLNVLDRAALNLWATIQAVTMSGFNVFCKAFIDNTLLEYDVRPVNDFVISTNTGGTLAGTFIATGDVKVTAVKYGTSLTAMSGSVDCTGGGGAEPYVYSIPDMVAGTTVYVQPYTKAVDNYFIAGVYKVLIVA